MQTQFVELLFLSITNITLQNKRPYRIDSTMRNNQAGFHPGRNCSQQRAIGAFGKHQFPLTTTFMDFKKAFDSINRSAMFSVIRPCGIPEVIKTTNKQTNKQTNKNKTKQKIKTKNKNKTKTKRKQNKQKNQQKQTKNQQNKTKKPKNKTNKKPSKSGVMGMLTSLFIPSSRWGTYCRVVFSPFALKRAYGLSEGERN